MYILVIDKCMLFISTETGLGWMLQDCNEEESILV